MVWMEDNICIYRYGEILHTSAVLVGTIHVIQGIYINWREPAFSSVVCKQKVCLTTKRRMAKEMQVVGGPNSTDEGMNKINTRGKSRENCSSQFWPAKLYQRGNIATVYKGNIIKNLIMDCQSYTKYRPNETTGGIFVSWRRKEELPTGA